MQLSEANERHAQDLQRAQSKINNLHEEIGLKNSQSKSEKKQCSLWNLVSQLEEQLQQTKRNITQHDNLHESIRSLQDQMRQMQTGQIPNYPSRPPSGPQISGPPQQAQYVWDQEDDLYYTTNGDSSNDQVFASRNSGASVNSSFVVPKEKYEKPDPFTPRPSASLSSFDEQQQPSAYWNQGLNQKIPENN